ncbi:MAG: Zn-ribbon domain-containing OB-fold protein, partial [Candidatus Binatia bacterium]
LRERARVRGTMLKNADTRAWPGEIPIQSFYTAGVGGQIFFKALKERGELVGTRCKPCNQVYLPARLFCERCFAELTEEVQVKPQGTVISFTICYSDHDDKPLPKPMALALVQLDGATTFLLHRLLKVKKPSEVRIGSRVDIVLKPKAKRTGSILDIEGFRLA